MKDTSKRFLNVHLSISPIASGDNKGGAAYRNQLGGGLAAAQLQIQLQQQYLQQLAATGQLGSTFPQPPSHPYLIPGAGGPQTQDHHLHLASSPQPQLHLVSYRMVLSLNRPKKVGLRPPLDHKVQDLLLLAVRTPCRPLPIR